jgi:hypothetical protein
MDMESDLCEHLLAEHIRSNFGEDGTSNPQPSAPEYCEPFSSRALQYSHGNDAGVSGKSWQVTAPTAVVSPK